MRLSILESLCPNYLRCSIYSTGEDRRWWCWKYIFIKCRRYFEQKFSGIDGVKNKFYRVSMTRINACTGIFGGAKIWKGIWLYIRKKINGKCGVNWNGFFIYLYFSKKFELESRHSRTVIESQFYKFLFSREIPYFFPVFIIYFIPY